MPVGFRHKKNLSISRFIIKMKEESQNTVVIIGAGLSGLSAAEYILRKNPSIQVIVLEAMNRVGGKTYTKEIMGTNFDMGAQFIGKTQKYVIDLANRANQQFIPQSDRGDKILFLNGKRSTYKTNIPKDANLFALTQMQLAIWKINRMAKKVPLLDPKDCQMGNYWDSITVQTWMEKNVWSQKVRLMFSTAVRVVLGAELSEVSFLYFLWFVHQNQSFDNIINIQNGLQERKLKNGTQSLSLFLQEEIQKLKGKILLNHWVKQINQSKQYIEVLTSSGNFSCKYLILATAPSIYRKIHFTPNLSPQKRHFIDKCSMGQLIKIVLLYDKQYWKEKGYSGEIVSDSYDDPILTCFDDTKFDDNGNVKQPALIVFTGAQVYRYWKEKGMLGKRVMEKVAQAFECEELLKPLAIQWFEFDQVPTICGSPLGIMSPGGLSHIQNIRRPQHNIHFAGTQMATISAGYMDGAIESGIRAGNQIIQKVANQLPNLTIQFQIANPYQQPWYNKLIRRTKKLFDWW